ncbi:MAG TPA: gas vesicle protein GvpG [Amycolatopsis sp.]|uniref:gas vesicle protein GvpG n=1 Tax=Amycolatopsis sp. TaxID=37632 RepID=UPI002B497688|nr:gas vesicle protein GvpG [Amycolatopsis sp.]HKS49757.1 gas vesicle protein GvpG [Amycolatopsis sp.]
MGLVTAVLGLPFAPVKLVVSLGELIQRRVEEELHDPASARRRLEAIERAREAGEITAEEEAEAQQQVLDRMIGSTAGL